MKLKILAEVEVNKYEYLSLTDLSSILDRDLVLCCFDKESIGTVSNLEILEARDSNNNPVGKIDRERIDKCINEKIKDWGLFFFDEPNDWLQYLINEGVIVVGGFISAENDPSPVGIAVLCSDVFAYAYADAEEINSIEELRQVAEAHLKDPQLGAIDWCINKRKQLPIKPLLEKLESGGYYYDDSFKRN